MTPAEPVLFTIQLQQGADARTVKNRLEQLAHDLSIEITSPRSHPLYWLAGKTTQATYEKIFHAQLKYSGRGWKEIIPASVPSEYKSEIVRIDIERLQNATL